VPAPQDESPRFLTTHWSVVIAAGATASPEKSEALEKLFATYWYPLYAYARRRGNAPELSQDLVQGFLCRMLETGGLGAADPQRGRFRSFLLTSFRNFTTNAAARESALKRGGGKRIFSFEGSDPESRLRIEPSHGATPERLYARDWALTVLDQVLQRLALEFARKGQDRFFSVGKDLLAGADPGTIYAEQAEALGMTGNAFRVALHRLRRRYRDALREEVAQTLSSGSDVEDELQELLAALAI
jgi:RNA polymerase sigma factor (sigma-70 family)